MSRSRPAALGFGLVVAIGVSALWAEPGRQVANQGPLDPGTVCVRLELGVGDRQAQDWSGRVEVDKGELIGVEGWRFRAGDQVIGKDRWQAGSRTLAAGQTKSPGAQIKKKAAGKGAAGKVAAKAGAATKAAAILTNGVIVSLKAPADATLLVDTARGSFKVALNDLADGSVRSYLEGKAQARRIPPSAAVAEAEAQEDFPAAAVDGQGGVWVAYVSHEARGPATLEPLQERPRSFADFAPSGGGDQVKLLRFAEGRRGRPIDVTEPGLDIWRPAVAIAGDGSIVVVWSELQEGSWDLYCRSYQPGRQTWSDRKRLTTNPGTDADPVLATAPDPDGRVWMAWQGWADGQADIWLAPVDGSSAAVNVSDTRANDWSPALAADRSGNLHVAYDTYQAGNYDVVLRTRSPQGVLGRPIAVADSWLFEARPSLTVDPRGRVWIAYEERTGNWGKDSGRLDPAPDQVLYAASNVRVRCLDGTRLLAAPDPVAQAPEAERAMNHFPRLASDRAGRVWLAFRHREDSGRGGIRQTSVGGTWVGETTALAGREWAPPQRLARSEGMLDGRASLVAPSDGAAWVVYVGDNRTVSGGDTVDANVHIAALTAGSASTGAVDPLLAEIADRPSAPPAPPVHPDEAADIARVRNHRIKIGGKTYQPLRGDFHRHTEVSFDGGSDGALEDMWRYAIDCAALDWIGNGDHDNGNHKEYTWWITQKTMELYHVPPAFTPMFSYERSNPYPNGHRNVMFVRRGVRPLPRLANPTGGVHDDDTKMLYDYLTELGGICAAHTTGTDQGTDWRDNNPKVEPMVEIYQGIRSSYEHLGAPRVARRADESVSGFEPAGMVWNALGLQFRLGFQASSDHISTHISYAVALAEDHTRAAILDAFKRRHCYAATDNILLDVRCGEHLMGDELDAGSGPIELRVLAHGTRPIARLDIIKDFMYAYSTEPKQNRVEFTWTDSERDRPAGVSWYYVRLIQDDGELAWGSPLWIRSSGNGKAAAPE
jgi:hypothetical protein